MPATTIMTQTLPTIVSTGVVARTTETMFGRKERDAKRAAKRAAPKRRVTRAKSRFPKVYTGKRGGKYIMRKGRRVYI